MARPLLVRWVETSASHRHRLAHSRCPIITWAACRPAKHRCRPATQPWEIRHLAIRHPVSPKNNAAAPNDLAPIGSGVQPAGWNETSSISQQPNPANNNPAYSNSGNNPGATANNSDSSRLRPQFNGMKVIDLTNAPVPPGYHAHGLVPMQTPSVQVPQAPTADPNRFNSASGYPAQSQTPYQNQAPYQNQVPYQNQLPPTSGQLQTVQPYIGQPGAPLVPQAPMQQPSQGFQPQSPQSVTAPRPGEIANQSFAAQPSASIAERSDFPSNSQPNATGMVPATSFSGGNGPSTEPLPSNSPQDSLQWRRPGTRF